MKFKLNPKQCSLIAIVYIAIFAIYNIIVMVAFEDKNNIFWTSYAFMCLAFVVNVGITVYTFKSLDVEAAFMGIPLMSFSIFYFICELFASTVFILFRNFVPMNLCITTQSIIALIFIIFSAIAILSKDAVESINSNIDTKVKTIKLLSVDVKILEDQCMDKELKNELHKIAESIRYSDPMTNDALADLENIIRGKVSELKHNCNNNNKNEALQTCYQLSSYISERNQKLILLK